MILQQPPACQVAWILRPVAPDKQKRASALSMPNRGSRTWLDAIFNYTLTKRNWTTALMSRQWHRGHSKNSTRPIAQMAGPDACPCQSCDHQPNGSAMPGITPMPPVCTHRTVRERASIPIKDPFSETIQPHIRLFKERREANDRETFRQCGDAS